MILEDLTVFQVFHFIFSNIFKPGVRASCVHAPGFLKLVRQNLHVCMSVQHSCEQTGFELQKIILHSINKGCLCTVVEVLFLLCLHEGGVAGN